jgi:hypothetical protein
MIAMTGRVTMLGPSRWTEKGGTFGRSVQRFFYMASLPVWVCPCGVLVCLGTDFVLLDNQAWRDNAALTELA